MVNGESNIHYYLGAEVARFEWCGFPVATAHMVDGSEMLHLVESSCSRIFNDMESLREYADGREWKEV